MAADYKGPVDYVDVADRIREFRERYPDGVLTRVGPDGQVVPVEFRSFAGKDWVVYTAFAYRGPDDHRPGVGTAWEPTPGPTKFTRDSEVQNAETAAWGRAMVASLAVDTRKGVASSQEVQNRQGPPAPPPPVDEELVVGFLAQIANAPDIATLQGVWEQAGRKGVTRDPRVIEAKDKAKELLS